MVKKRAIVIGAGIVGLAAARALAGTGYKVTVIERTQRAIGASIRNFGMIWPVGQPAGELYERAMLSRAIWKQVCTEAGIWYDESGSLHVAYAADELDVLEEFEETGNNYAQYRLLTPEETLQRSEAVVDKHLKGALWSPDEMIVDPRQAIALLPGWLQEKYGVEFRWGQAVTDIAYPAVFTGNESLEADRIIVCSGADFETLYPELYRTVPITKCKLQMMRLASQPGGWRIGPSLCGALSLLHYKSFAAAPSLSQLRERLAEFFPLYMEWGIHVMVSQNGFGELTVGDSHEYGITHDPFDKQFINQLILDYLRQFARFKDETVIETWNGIYPKLTNGQTSIVLEPEQGVMIINGLGGAGMTLSFGLCEQLLVKGMAVAP
jgi:FAD dependent oxidoreductase TIGR03364